MPLTIVYLDDEEMLCEAFKDGFETDDIKIRVFTDPDEAIADINSNPPDYVFLDYRLPKTNADKVAKRLDPKLKKVLITGELSIQTETAFIKVFKKPYKFQDMIDFFESLKKQ